MTVKRALVNATVLVIFTAALLSSCISSQKSTTESRAATFWNARDLLAWREDTASKLLFGMDRSGKFYYTVITTVAGKKTRNYYQGHWKKMSDTILLLYRHSVKPAELSNYLLVEVGGHYLIQELEKAGPRKYLEINGIPRFGRGFYRPKPWE